MTWWLRGAFVALLLVTAGWKLAAAPQPRQSDAIANDIAAVLGGRSTGAVAGQPWSNTISIYSAPISGCAAPLIVVAGPANFSAASVLERMQRPADHHLFAYRDWISDRPERWVLLGRQIWGKALTLMGLNIGGNADKMLFIAEPAGCEFARGLPWRRFWAPR